MPITNDPTTSHKFKPVPAILDPRPELSAVLVPRRVLDAHDRITKTSYGKQPSAAHPAEHVEAWRRTVQTAFEAPPTVQGEALDATTLQLLLEVYRELKATTPAFASIDGALLVLSRGRLTGTDAYPSKAVDRQIALRLYETSGWMLENENTQGTTDEWAPERDMPQGVLKLPEGAWCALERRNPRQAPEPEYELTVLPLADQWAWAAAQRASKR